MSDLFEVLIVNIVLAILAAVSITVIVAVAAS